MSVSEKQLDQHDHNHAQNRFAVIPTPLRMDADEALTGKGVTMAFLDSGFYPHPDLTQPVNRIAAFVDITQPFSSPIVSAGFDAARAPEGWAWHGTQTSVVAAGNGRLSDGVYRGLAEASLVVLVKVGDRGRITEENIERGLRWVIENKDRYKIRVISISLGGDADVSYKENAVDLAAEEAVRRGLTVVVAAGNSGCSDRHHTVPPANSPSVITVGGYDDKNTLDGEADLYCSSYGETTDGVVKPEIIAPAMWVAAPILPRTDAYTRAESLSQIALAPDYLLARCARVVARPAYLQSDSEVDLWKKAGLPESLRVQDLQTIRATAEMLLKESKIVAAHYQHVDGTSFAAPIVASLVAQMLEANPTLTPAAIKHILISTADRIKGAPAMRQGYGTVNARRAIDEARRERHTEREVYFCPPRVENGELLFAYHNDAAERVALAGDFNDWTSAPFIKDDSGVWRASVRVPPPGRYLYKFIVDETRWIEDPANGLKEPDNFGGFNSVLNVNSVTQA